MTTKETTVLSSNNLLPALGLANDTTWLACLYDNNKEYLQSKQTQITVIIPYYKRPITLAQTLNSLLRNEYNLSLIEIIIVDDGSPIDFRPDISFYIDRGLDIKYIWQADKGYRVSAARNIGLRAAKNDNIIILDCDLAVDPGFLRAHSNILNISSNVISIGLRDSYGISPETQTNDFLEKDPCLIGCFKKEDWRVTSWLRDNKGIEHSDFCWRLCSGGNIAFHKSIISKIGFFSEDFIFWGGEDLEWAYRAHKEGIYFHINKDAKAYHYDCREEEYQVDRYLNEDKKNQLLKDLVPIHNSQQETEGHTPYVSIFITSYNKATFITKAIESVSLATKYRHEIVIVDDGSTDDTEIRVAEIENNARQEIIFIKREHEGVEKTYRDCLSYCRGEFIAQLDADDELLPNSIDTIISHIDNSPIDIGYGKYTRFIDEETSVDLPLHSWTYPHCDRFLSIFQGMYTHPLRVFKRRSLQRVGGLRLLGLEAAVDFSLYSQLLMVTYGKFVDINSYKYRQIATSISNSKLNIQDTATKQVITDNAHRMIHSQDFSIAEVSRKKFEIKTEDTAFCVYLDHLGIRDQFLLQQLIKIIYRNPVLCIYDFFNTKA